MNTATHTPTPWTIKPNQKYLIVAGVPNMDKGRVASCASYDHSSEAEANAAHIVRCVNAHDELVLNLRAAEAYIKVVADHTGLEPTVLLRIRAALAKAGAA